MSYLPDPIVQSVYANLKNASPNSAINFAILKIAVSDPVLKKEYEKRGGDHNKKFLTNLFMDAGFDLIVPSETVFNRDVDSKFIDMGIKTEMLYCDVSRDVVISTGYYVYPRSSISKTPLMLANHVGIVDSGYRGSLIGAFRMLLPLDSTEDESYTVEKYTRLLQICHPSLCPVFVVFVDEEQLSSTERGAGGFGSTGV
jgi:dUTP pyrophosphatase